MDWHREEAKLHANVPRRVSHLKVTTATRERQLHFRLMRRHPRMIEIGFTNGKHGGQIDDGAPGCLSGCARAKASIFQQASTMRLKVGYGEISHLKYAAPIALPHRQISASVICSLCA
jgi:hypothetical protein